MLIFSYGNEKMGESVTLGAGRPFDFQKNSPSLGHAFFGAKQHGEQRLLKAFCPLWENPANLFEKKNHLGY